MIRYEEYKAGEIEPRRVNGTAIGKAAVREFVRGLKIRLSSPYELKPKTRVEWIAKAAWYFFKYLAEIRGFSKAKSKGVKILVVWKDIDEKVYSVSNMMQMHDSGMTDADFGLWACRDMIYHVVCYLTNMAKSIESKEKQHDERSTQSK